MFKLVFRHPFFLIMLLLALAVKGVSTQEEWIEVYYSGAFYPAISAIFRALLGWIPFSAGDIIYTTAALYLLFSLFKALRSLQRNGRNTFPWGSATRQVLMISLGVYVVFNVCWGLNYNRKGISMQLNLKEESYNTEDLTRLAMLLQHSLCSYGEQVNAESRRRLNTNNTLFKEGVAAYDHASRRFPFLQYRVPSIKPSLLTPFGHYFGFTGYYNPFTGEAQLKTTIPVFLKPFVLCHEIAHQLGYAKENEANMVGFLTAKSHVNKEFRYSAYFEMYLYALGELGRRERGSTLLFWKTAHPQVLLDRQEYLSYLEAQENGVEPFISGFYDRYLKLNNQPKGKGSYNAVVAWLVAYMKKNGAASI